MTTPEAILTLKDGDILVFRDVAMSGRAIEEIREATGKDVCGVFLEGDQELSVVSREILEQLADA